MVRNPFWVSAIRLQPFREFQNTVLEKEWNTLKMAYSALSAIEQSAPAANSADSRRSF
jgi:hypothetical protein